VILRAPEADELEISLFGPGYGESVVIHLGLGRWMVVDSCIDPSTKRAAALVYLEAIGVDCATDVKFVLATHWHDDHIRGLGEIVAVCEGARFICSTALQNRDFLVLTQSEVLGAERTTSGVREFASILEILRDRKHTGNSQCGPAFAVENVLIDQTETCEIKALSPSSAAVQRAMASIASLLPERRRPHLRVAAPSANEGSVALWLKGAYASALLGADLEAASSDDRGWGAVLQLKPAASGAAGLFKVAHHGSITGHDQRVWDHLLEKDPRALLTPWSRGGEHLPTDADRARILSLSSSATLVGRPSAKPKRYDAAVERVLREVAQSRQAAVGRLGHTRARSSLADRGSWRLDRIANSTPLSEAA
jgi:beta-lactamase superfamily II metal-dependent hydrolase